MNVALLGVNGDEGICPPEAEYSPCVCRDYYGDGTLLLDCDYRSLDDQQISDMLNFFLPEQGISPLSVLRLENNKLTKIPTQIKSFPRLKEVYLWQNAIETIETESLHFIGLEKLVGMGDKVKVIEPGAFTGITFGKTLT